MVIELSKQRRYLAPLAFVVGALGMLFDGVKLLVTNWRLTLIQLLPAMWIWAAMIDLKAHVLHGKSFHTIRGPLLILPALAIITLTAFGYFLNAVFAFAISKAGPPDIRPAFTEARKHLRIVGGYGVAIGLMLAFSTLIAPRWGRGWFAISLSIVIGIMMVTYVAIPARLIGMKTTYSRRDKLTAAAVGGALGAVVCLPPYLLARDRASPAGLQDVVHPWSHPHDSRPDAGGRHHQRRQDHKDELEPRGRAQRGLTSGVVTTSSTTRATSHLDQTAVTGSRRSNLTGQIKGRDDHPRHRWPSTTAGRSPTPRQSPSPAVENLPGGGARVIRDRAEIAGEVVVQRALTRRGAGRQLFGGGASRMSGATRGGRRGPR